MVSTLWILVLVEEATLLLEMPEISLHRALRIRQRAQDVVVQVLPVLFSPHPMAHSKARLLKCSRCRCPSSSNSKSSSKVNKLKLSSNMDKDTSSQVLSIRINLVLKVTILTTLLLHLLEWLCHIIHTTMRTITKDMDTTKTHSTHSIIHDPNTLLATFLME
jgi:hypothetical protein